MKKPLAFLFFLFYFLCYGVSQDTNSHKKPSAIQSRPALSLSFGQGRPLGSFSFSNANIQSAPNQSHGYANGNCFADPGGLFNADYSLPLYKTWLRGIIRFGYNENGFDAYNYSRFYVPKPNNATYNTEISATATDYIMVMLLGGIRYTYQIKRFTFDFNLLAGPLFCNTPDILYSQTTPYNEIPSPGMSIPTEYQLWDTVTSTLHMSIALEAGLEIGYRIRKNTYAMIGASYLYSNQTVHIETKTYEDPGGQLSFPSMISIVTSPITIPISLLNLTIGVKLLL